MTREIRDASDFRIELHTKPPFGALEIVVVDTLAAVDACIDALGDIDAVTPSAFAGRVLRDNLDWEDEEGWVHPVCDAEEVAYCHDTCSETCATGCMYDL